MSVFVDVLRPIGADAPILLMHFPHIVGEFVNLLDGVVPSDRPLHILDDVVPRLEIEESPLTIKTASYFVHSPFDLIDYIGIAVLVLKVEVSIFFPLLNGVGELTEKVCGVELLATDVDGDVFFHCLFVLLVYDVIRPFVDWQVLWRDICPSLNVLLIDLCLLNGFGVCHNVSLC
jgi:hypothetical protein